MGAHTDALREEHDELDATSRAIAAGARGATSRFDDALARLRRDVLREEQGLFPAADQLLDPAAWTASSTRPIATPPKRQAGSWRNLPAHTSAAAASTGRAAWWSVLPMAT